MRGRIRLGLYMFTPMIGGAEGYFRDLVSGLDRGSFDVTVFAVEWPAFDRFLAEAEPPPFSRRVVRVAEAVSPRRDSPSDPSRGAVQTPSTLRTVVRLLPGYGAVRPAINALEKYFTWPINVRRLQRAFESEGIDVLHVVNGGYPGARSAQAAMVAADRGGIRTVMTVCSQPMSRVFVQRVETRIDERIASASSAVFVPGRRPAKAMEALRGFPNAKLRVVPWGVSAPPIPDALAIADARTHVGVPESAMVVAMVANFAPTKGHAALVDAASALRARIPHLHLLLAGTGPTLDAVRDLVRQRGLADVVHFAGAVTDPFVVYRAADIVALPSEIEGLPYVVLEALSQGRPVVATDVGAVPEAVVDGETGFLVAVGDHSALVAALERLVTDRPMRERMGVNARALYDERFSRRRMIDTHEAVYREVAP
jgi:glycosyltransferase involved in cell wall biosynthesis